MAPIDSMVVADFTDDGADITAEVIFPNGLVAPAIVRVDRNTLLPAITGFANTLQLAVDERGTAARLGVTVQRTRRDCALADEVKSPRARGAAIGPVR